MKRFAELYFALDTTNDPEVKTRALVQYLRKAPPEDAIWALRLLLGKRPHRLLPLDDLQQLARKTVQLPDWLIEESLKAVKDSLEAMTLLLPSAESPEGLPLHRWLGERFTDLRNKNLHIRNEKIRSSWEHMDFQQRFVWNKLLVGSFRLQLPDSLVVNALSAASGLEQYVLAYRLKQKGDTNPETYHALIAPEIGDVAASRPYPFVSWKDLDKNIIQGNFSGIDPRLRGNDTSHSKDLVVIPAKAGIHTAGASSISLKDQNDIQNWHIEWDWAGLRVQCVKRQEQFFLWSQETDLLTDKFPELHEFGQSLPDGTVIEAQIVGWQNNSVLPLETLQARIRRKHLTKKLLQETPARVFAVDLLEDGGRDIRHQPFSQRRNRLATLLEECSASHLSCSPGVRVTCWAELDRAADLARKNGAAGLNLIPLDATEIDDENSETWRTWKAQPFTLLGVLLYVQRRQGPSLNPVTEYSLGVRDGDGLIKVASAEATFPQEEQEEIDLFVKENTIERFGPVRSVRAELVFELSFDDIRRSARHKAGLKLDNPKIIRWCRGKSTADADSLARLRELLCETSEAPSIPAQ